MMIANKVYISVAEQPFPVHRVCDSSSENKCDNYLSMKIAHKMIKQFLIEKKMSRTGLAEKLGLSSEEFEKFYSVYGYRQLAPVASYRLICLYCRTKWN